MFNKILIANRGEIACRIIATCRRLGVGTVAVYSEADEGARHVRQADEAVAIGPAAASQSYLDGGRIIEAARESGAKAIHPGYGFLAENAAFARAVGEAGLVFVGPDVATIEAMGSKARAKAIMEAAAVPLVPGYHGDGQDDEHLAAEAEKVGFPLMLKAAAGGGGKGMRVVHTADEFSEALNAARREAKGAFGDERMILERYLPRPRHIEAQVFGDRHGRIVHLFERDCSSQRRHQKVIEEAPAPGLEDALRSGLLDSAVRAAKAVDYVGAGTVEFLVDGGEFFFLEMNTRLQVEHPVTEAVTGQDLVEWQLLVAAGEKLPLTQDEIRLDGHAMEARIYAEDAARGFLPASGRIGKLAWPDPEHCRIDTGVEAGDAVSVHYDPMIAKLIVHSPDRDRCRARLREALDQCFVGGLMTNLGFLQQLAGSAAFTAGQVDTGLLDRALDEILDAGAPPVPVVTAAACTWLAAQERAARESSPEADSPWAIPDGWRLSGPEFRSLDVECGSRRLMISAVGQAATGYRLEWDGAQIDATLEGAEGPATVLIDGSGHAVMVHVHGDTAEICLEHRRWRLVRHTRFESVAALGTSSGRVVSPMPGKLIQVRVAEGDEVTEGQVLAVMEAMKMELSIKAPAAGTVSGVAVTEGDLVEADVVLMEIGLD